MVAKRIPTHVGDVLIVQTTHSFTTHAVGRVIERGQQDFGNGATPTHFKDYVAAVGHALTLAGPRARIFLRNLDTESWSELPR